MTRTAWMKHLTIRPLESRDVAPIFAAFNGLGWNRPRSQCEPYLSEQQSGTRTVFVAFVGEAIVWSPSYPSFLAAGIPEN
jgi:hypothetical protein